MPDLGTPRSSTFVHRGRHELGQLLLKGGSLAKRSVKAWFIQEPPPLDPPIEELPRYDVVAYFADTPNQAYQLRQWLPVLERVAHGHPLAVVTRNWAVTLELRQETTLPVIYSRTLDGLRRVYDQIDVKTVVYVNNGWRNFQSLIHQRSLHVHVNHGESDKVSMVSNQAKAYDHVVVAGQAAIERHARALINFDIDRLVVCGRPQLDLEVSPVLAPAPGRRTVVYAPTWSGEDDTNNYTSVDVYGVAIVRALLGLPDVRVVYKPHPRVLTATEPGVVGAHAEIARLLTAARAAGAPHEMPFDADILGLFDDADLLVTDISSVGLDFLYLRPEAPVVLTDRRTDRARIVAEAPVASAVDIVDGGSVGDVAEILAANLAADPRHDARLGVRDHYFGFPRGESSRRFLDFMSDCVDRRDAMLVGRPARAVQQPLRDHRARVDDIEAE
ncbi:CDP-glycerol glycerophosphotransferase family protein [Cellulosimicrobium arenosum]|uniref:CDP-glycerol glycerophosphotransferase family protein n=1 Tax=Cellulosimicrobium arenosum TaxID=2708133 RepID=A0A927J1I7_9MICO|nr:CDP-glycerol glycerophosphotransferase family protein [Cellulosimicrobium arenosum]MBD8080183.1 CDP-glycerol glycerophosphotransferase family protein [Cellulosimicrobium arenosum]